MKYAMSEHPYLITQFSGNTLRTPPRPGSRPVVSLRPAVPEDAPLAARLLHMSMGRIADALFCCVGRETDDVLYRMFTLRGNRFSHEFGTIAELDGVPVGLMIAYPGRGLGRLGIRMAAQVPPILGARGLIRFLYRALPLALDREARADEYHINSLAVLPHARSQGVGTRLLKHAEEQALALGLHRCSLTVATGNARAQSLYERLSYRPLDATEPSRWKRLADHRGVLAMVKTIGKADLRLVSGEHSEPVSHSKAA
jgi:ribosomal protein S18 acetylase RimI-like enzyme